MSADDLATLHTTFTDIEPTDAGERLALRTRDEFVEQVFYQWGYDVGGLIIGFNLPFDLSRIAKSHTWAKGDVFKGGFSRNAPRSSSSLARTASIKSPTRDFSST